MAKKIILTHSQKNRMLKMYDDGLSLNAITSKFHFSYTVTRQFFREEGINVTDFGRGKKDSGIKFTKRERTDIVKRYDAGYGESTVQISKVYDCSYATIRRVLKEENVYNPEIVHNKIFFDTETINTILGLYEEGDSAKNISRQFECSDGIIRSLLKEYGIDTSDYGRGHRNRLVVDRGLWKTCRGLSRVIYKNNRTEINPQRYKISKYGYHLDHKIPVSIGYHSDLTVLDLAHPCNLQVISASNNLSKYTKQSIDRRTLLKSIKDWNKKHGDPFEPIAMEIEYTYKYGRYKFFGGDFRYNWGVR